MRRIGGRSHATTRVLVGACPGSYNRAMKVRFVRTGVRRYAVFVAPEGTPPGAMDPAPAYDDDIPHDLVHYVVEAELGLANGVYGRAAQGAGTFVASAQPGVDARERARMQRKRGRRERALGAEGARDASDLAESERLAGLCDVAWRRKHSQRRDPLRSAPTLRTEDLAKVDRIVTRLDLVAPLWRALPVGGELVFEWPGVVPTPVGAPSGGSP